MGNSVLQAIQTETTCGEACWAAREDVCRCSCGGAHHGCLRAADGTAPARMSKIDGRRYVLAGVGRYSEIERRAEALLAASSERHVSGGYAFPYRAKDRGAAYRTRAASRAEIARWPELAASRGQAPWVAGAYLLWRREDVPASE